MILNTKYKDFLHEKTLVDVLKDKPERPLVRFSNDSTLDEILSVLKKENILSAPIFDSKTNQIVAFVDTLDIACYLTQDVGDIEKDPSKLTKCKVSDLIEKVWKTKDVYVIPISETLSKVIHNFSKHSKHRALVVDSKNKELTIVSQTDIIKFLAKNEKKLESVIHTRLEDLNLVNPLGQPVKHMKDTDLAIDGFRYMSHETINALAILNDKGILVGNISISDLRQLDQNKISLLQKPVLEFLDSIGKKCKPVVAKSRNSLLEAMHIAIFAGVHRVWVTNEREEPIGIVTYSDMLRAFCD